MKACEQHWLLLCRYFNNKREIKQWLSCNAGQAKFLAARAEILAGGGANRQQVGLSPPPPWSPSLKPLLLYIHYHFNVWHNIQNTLPDVAKCITNRRTQNTSKMQFNYKLTYCRKYIEIQNIRMSVSLSGWRTGTNRTQYALGKTGGSMPPMILSICCRSLSSREWSMCGTPTTSPTWLHATFDHDTAEFSLHPVWRSSINQSQVNNNKNVAGCQNRQ